MKTEQGRTAALAALKARRKENAKTKRVDNSKLPAGAPMYFYCISCGEPIVVPESYVTRSSLCQECDAMNRLGWLT